MNLSPIFKIYFSIFIFDRSSLSLIKVRSLTFDNVLSCWLDPLKSVNKCRKKLADRCTGLYCHKECPATLHPLSGMLVKIPPPPLKGGPIQLPDNAKFYLELLNRLNTLGSHKTDKSRQTER